MEEQGIVGPFEGSKPRQLMITREQWQERKMAVSGGSAPMEPLDSPEPSLPDEEDEEIPPFDPDN